MSVRIGWRMRLTHVFRGAVRPVHQKQLHGVQVVEVAGLVQRRPPEVVFLVLVASDVEERLADLSVYNTTTPFCFCSGLVGFFWREGVRRWHAERCAGLARGIRALYIRLIATVVDIIIIIIISLAIRQCAA